MIPLFSLLTFLTGLPLAAAAELQVRLIDVPDAARQMLAAQRPDVSWGGDGEPGLALAWTADAQRRSLQQHPGLPVIALAQRGPPGHARPQDAWLIWAPALTQQVQLMRRLDPRLQRVGLVTRNMPQSEVDQLRRDHLDLELRLLPVRVSPDPHELSEFAAGVDMLLADNDDTLFNRDTAKYLLLSAYRRQRAWVGPTPEFVQAGAVATWSLSRQALIQAIIDQVDHWQRHRRLAGNRQLAADQLVVNAQVARALYLQVPAEGRRVP